MQLEDLKLEREYVKQGDLLDSQGLFEQAIAAYDDALAIVPGDADVIYDKAATLEKSGQLAEAMKCFETANRMYSGEV